MPDSSEIPYLLNLLDDESEEIRDMIQKALASFGPALEQEVLPYTNGLDTGKLSVLQQLYKRLRMQDFEQVWPAWLEIPGYAAPLEAAHSSLSFLANGYNRPALGSLLDDLEEQFLASNSPSTSQALMHFLFNIKRLAPPREDYYAPGNSDLVQVITSKEGIQLSLSCIAILVGQRLGIDLLGLNVPGHFMILATDAAEPIILDPFSQGRPISSATIGYLKHSLQLDSYESLFALKASPGTIILRVLRNLMNAWDRKGDRQEVDLYERASKTLIDAIRAHNS
jgi:regulator of sirC expression with transglutaminase-like and TPR domain